MLWRALGHVAQGCYVDIGAQHPVIDSVSLAFYERGWRGVHIEPVPMYADLLRQHRPDETVLQMALGDAQGTILLRVIPETGLSTVIDDYADQALQARGLESLTVEVPMDTMNHALAFLRSQEVHWMKVDVEGFEAQVLRGWDASWLRPWILVVEAVLPGTVTPCHQSWEPTVLAAGYDFVYFDGLNRFYCAREHASLAAAFAAPPNVADDILLTAHSSMLADVNRLHERQLGDYRKQLAALPAIETESAARLREVQHLARAIQDLQASRSWRITAPLRAAADLLRKLRQARREGRLVTAVAGRLRRMLSGASGTSVASSSVDIDAGITPSDLSPRALEIQRALIHARQQAQSTPSQGSAG